MLEVLNFYIMYIYIIYNQFFTKASIHVCMNHGLLKLNIIKLYNY